MRFLGFYIQDQNVLNIHFEPYSTLELKYKKVETFKPSLWRMNPQGIQKHVKEIQSFVSVHLLLQLEPHLPRRLTEGEARGESNHQLKSCNDM